MSDVRVLVLRAAGINCDEEVMHCWRQAGAEPTLTHLNRLAASPDMLDPFQIITVPGGFSYGDDIAAGQIMAQRMLHALYEPLMGFVARGGGILGICNGFQVLVKMGLLPGGEFGRDQVTVTYNDSAKFEARWVTMEVCTDRCPFLSCEIDGAGAAAHGLSSNDRVVARTPCALQMPVEHAEGKVVTADEQVVESLLAAGQLALRYVDGAGRYDTYPANPNGSAGGIAGLCDPTGRIFGLMPHPDRHFDHTQHPHWTSHESSGPPDGLRVFTNAVLFWSTELP